MPRFRTAAVVVALLCAHESAFAENPSPMPEWMYSAGVPLMHRFMDEVPTWQVTLGGSVEGPPKYPAPSRYHVLGGPMFDIRYKERAFLATGEGLGVNFVATDLG